MGDSFSPAEARRWTDCLIEDDRRYFAAGATLHPLPGGHLAMMPGEAKMSAGAVVLIDAPESIMRDPVAWRDGTTAVCQSAGARQLRFYTRGGNTRLAQALTSLGMSGPSVELAMAGPVKEILAKLQDEFSREWSIREVTTPDLWRTKRRLHDRTPERPDGKAVDAASWVQFERDKVAAGYMTPWLIEKKGIAYGAFGISRSPEILRFKNLFIAPEFRNRGAARGVLHQLAIHGLKIGAEAIGCFAFPGGHGARLYQRAGFFEVGHQLEWLEPVTGRLEIERSGFRDAVG